MLPRILCFSWPCTSIAAALAAVQRTLRAFEGNQTEKVLGWVCKGMNW